MSIDERFGIYLCNTCGDLADENGNIIDIDKEARQNFLNKVKFLRKQLITLSVQEAQLKINIKEILDNLQIDKN